MEPSADQLAFEAACDVHRRAAYYAVGLVLELTTEVEGQAPLLPNLDVGERAEMAVNFTEQVLGQVTVNQAGASMMAAIRETVEQAAGEPQPFPADAEVTAVEPEAVEPEAVEPEAVEPEAVEPVEPEAAQPPAPVVATGIGRGMTAPLTASADA